MLDITRYLTVEANSQYDLDRAAFEHGFTDGQREYNHGDAYDICEVRCSAEGVRVARAYKQYKRGFAAGFQHAEDTFSIQNCRRLRAIRAVVVRDDLSPEDRGMVKLYRNEPELLTREELVALAGGDDPNPLRGSCWYERAHWNRSQYDRSFHIEWEPNWPYSSWWTESYYRLDEITVDEFKQRFAR